MNQPQPVKDASPLYEVERRAQVGETQHAQPLGHGLDPPRLRFLRHLRSLR